jgi:regulator of ribosome biosynthesis
LQPTYTLFIYWDSIANMSLTENGNYEEILDKVNEESSNSKETAKSIVELDLGNLMSFDPRPLDASLLKSQKETYLKRICTLSTQLLIDKLFNLPVERVEDVFVAKLPKPTTLVPREKPVPKEKPPTKWEQYAKLKGIQKKKKSRMAFDEASGEWKPTWGYKRKNDTTKDWLIELKKNQDPNEDHFAKRTQEKNERVAKNELQRLRNIARSTKKKIPGVGLTPTVDSNKPDKLQVSLG